MSTPTDSRRPTRIISKAQAGRDQNEHETVNIVATKPSDPHKAIKEHVQLTAAQTKPGVHETLIDSGGTVKGLRTIYINGYTAPN
jgi:hypothetical protein